MRYFITSIIAAVSVVCPTIAAPTASDDPLSKYGIETLSWSIEVAPGQIEVLNGTIQEVVAQAVAINADFSLPSASPDAAVSARSLSKRNVICGNFPSASKQRIQEGIAYLNRLPSGDRPTNGPGPGNCGRVSCSYNSAIWWCNDNRFSYSPGHWDNIANSAQNVVNSCASVASQVSGQSFESGNWNTIVRGDSC